MNTPSRREVLLGAAGLAAGTRPNVLFVISDQLHHAALGAAGNAVIRTPNLDRLAAQGVRFEHAVCATPFCSPTRASFLTGLYPHRHRITYNVRDPEEGLDPRLPSTEQILFENGYTCRQFGKWHLGARGRLKPYAEQGDGDFRDDEGPRQHGPGLGRHGLPVVMAESVRRANEKYDAAGAANTLIGRIDLPRERMIESRITDDAIGELDRLAAKPFFLTVSLPAPHAPWEVGEPYYSLHPRDRIKLPENRHGAEPADSQTAALRFGRLLGEEGLREYLGVYYGLVAMVDWNVGRLLDALARRGLERDTLVVFTADHGDMQGGHGMYDKTSFSMYEETTRVPLVVRWPGRIPAGKVARTQAGSCDLHPTILDYMGLRPRGAVHGRSLRSVIDGREDLERPIFSERERGEKNFQRTIRTLEWKYCFSSTGASQLYDLRSDPGETRNLVEQASARATKRDLHTRLARWMRDTEDPRAASMPEA
jgi:arylsulfatase A-like enzyme